MPKRGYNIKQTGVSPYEGPNAKRVRALYKYSQTIDGVVTEIRATLSPSIDRNGNIYIGTVNGYLYALEPSSINGRFTKKWVFRPQYTGGIWSVPLIGNNSVVYISSEWWIHAIDIETGIAKWSINTNSGVNSSISIRNNVLYVGSGDHYLYALNPSDGSTIWKYKADDGIQYSSPAIANDGTIYFGANDGHLHAVNPNGTLKWKYDIKNDSYSSPAIGSDGTIYIGSNDNNIYAIKPDGTFKWKYPTNGMVYSSPSIGNSGTIYIGSMDGTMYALNSNGTLKWSYKTGDAIFMSTAAIDSNETIYFKYWNTKTR
jgi:outer membrane protein assembly factor BamB